MADTRLRRGGEKPCKFCAIAAGSEKAFVVFRDACCAAFLDHRPLALGHVLLIPLAHYRDLSEVPDAVMKELGVRVKMLSGAVIAAMAADGSFVALNNLVSQSVPHVHFHIVPRHKGDGLFARRMIWKRIGYRDDVQREEIATRIRLALGQD
jgi:histidine triad (HIT) family protein